MKTTGFPSPPPPFVDPIVTSCIHRQSLPKSEQGNPADPVSYLGLFQIVVHHSIIFCITQQSYLKTLESPLLSWLLSSICPGCLLYTSMVMWWDLWYFINRCLHWPCLSTNLPFPHYLCSFVFYRLSLSMFPQSTPSCNSSKVLFCQKWACWPVLSEGLSQGSFSFFFKGCVCYTC